MKHVREAALQLLLPPMTTGPPGATIEASQLVPAGSAGDTGRIVSPSHNEASTDSLAHSAVTRRSAHKAS